jgi:hypothetical protein
MPYMETTTHRQRAEIAAEKRSPFKPHRGLAAPDRFLDTMLDRRIGETCLIDYMESLSNIYGSGSQTCHLKSKTYSDAQLGEVVQFIAVEHASEHEVVCGSKPIGDKRGEGETTAERQPPRASDHEVATSSRG